MASSDCFVCAVADFPDDIGRFSSPLVTVIVIVVLVDIALVVGCLVVTGFDLLANVLFVVFALAWLFVTRFVLVFDDAEDDEDCLVNEGFVLKGFTPPFVALLSSVRSGIDSPPTVGIGASRAP